MKSLSIILSIEPTTLLIGGVVAGLIVVIFIIRFFIINGRNAATKEEIEQMQIWDMQCELDIHSGWLNNFKDKYLSE